MSYIFKGKLWDKTENSLEPLSNVIIKLYTPESTLDNVTDKNPQVLIAESQTGLDGNFVIEINQLYSEGQELQVDIHCERISGSADPHHSPINFKSLTINPGRSKLKMESFKMGTITFLSIFSAA